MFNCIFIAMCKWLLFTVNVHAYIYSGGAPAQSSADVKTSAEVYTPKNVCGCLQLLQSSAFLQTSTGLLSICGDLKLTEVSKLPWMYANSSEVCGTSTDICKILAEVNKMPVDIWSFRRLNSF